MAKIKNFKKYLFWALLIGLAIISYYIIEGFIVAIVSSILLAFIVLPLHKLLSKKINKKISALLSLTLVLLIIILLGSFIATTLISQLSSIISGNSLPQLAEKISGFVNKYLPSIPSLSPIIKEIGKSSLNYLYNALTYLPHFFLTIILTFFIGYYLLIDWKKFKKQIIKIIPLDNKKEIVNRVSKTSKQIIYGALITALVSFLVALGGFYILGIKYWAFLAFLTAIFTFIPVIGPFIVWLPVLVIELIQGNFIIAIGVLILGGILSVLIDNFVRIWIIGKEAKLHPVIVLLGILGGLPLFGLAGFIIGPLILSIFIDIIKSGME